MNIKVIAVGKIREQGFKLALDEFVKRLGSYCSFSIVEIPAQTIKDDALAEKYMEEEAQKILAVIKPNSYVVTMEIEGKILSSEDFAKKIDDISKDGTNEICFIIGGSNGIAQSLRTKSNFKLSFSKMTFPHQLARVMLVEQIYRAMKILAKEPYHK